MNKKQRSWVILIFISAMAIACLWRFRNPQKIMLLDSGPVSMLGTVGRIQICCQQEPLAREVMRAALDTVQKMNTMLSTYRPDSELSKVNNEAAHHPVEVSEPTYEVLKASLRYSRLSDGAFDITVEPILAAWRRAADENRRPSEQELKSAQLLTGFDKLILIDGPPHQVSFAVDGVRLNVNAIAKGYIVDQALAAIRRPGIQGAMVDIGGEIACFGKNQDGGRWQIGIQDPFTPDNADPLSENARWAIQLTDYAVATSGNYRDFYLIDGRRFSHILDPRTAQPVDVLPSVTIIAPTTIEADALATAVSVMGAEKGLALLKTLKSVECFLISGTADTPTYYRSNDFSHYEISNGF